MAWIGKLLAHVLGLLFAVLALVSAVRTAEVAPAGLPAPIRVGVTGEFPPYYFSSGTGRYEGFVVDLMEALSSNSGLRFEYRRYASFSAVLDALQRHEIDMTPFTSETPERRAYLHFVRPLFSTQTVIVADRRLSDLSTDEMFSRYRVAVERGSVAEHLLRAHYPRANVVGRESVEQAIIATASGEADLCITFRQVAVYFMEKHFTANLVLRGSLSSQGTALGPAVRNDLPELAEAIDRAVAGLSTEDLARLTLKWLPKTVVQPTPGPAAPLSQAQREWIRQRGSVRLGFDSAFSPISFSGAAGGFEGLAADITRLIAEKAGLIISYEQGGAFADVLDQARTGRIDIVAAAARNADRAREFDFVGPILRVPTVVVAPEAQMLGDGLDTAGARRLALLRQHFLLPQIRARHPGLTPIEYDTQAQALEAVRKGEADLALGNMKVVNQLLEARHVGALKTIGTVPEGDSELFLAVPKREPQLAAILRVALDAATPAELAAIENRWLRIEFTAGLPWQRAILIAIAALAVTTLIVGSLWISIRRLKAGNRAFAAARAAAEAQVQARAQFSAYLSHELRGTLGGLSGGLGLLENGTLAPGRAGALTTAMKSSANTLLNLCERTLDVERWLQGRGVDLVPAPVVLADVIRSALTPLQVQAELKGLRLESQLDFDPGQRVDCDALRLTQVIHNLVGNAVKFTSQGGVVLRASLAANPGSDGALELRLEVEDTGPGIEADDLATMFEPFGQGNAGRQRRSGAGLGLAIVGQIVRAMGGDVRVAQTSPKGSVVAARMTIRSVALSIGQGAESGAVAP